MQSPKKSKSLFTNITARQYFIAAIIAFVLDLIIMMATQDFRPTTKAEAIIPGMLAGALGWVAIICVIAGIVKWFSSRKK